MTKQVLQFKLILKEFVRRKNVLRFTRKLLLSDIQFMNNMVKITRSKTPDEQCSFLLQKLRKHNQLIFLDYAGTYELITKL